MDEKEDKRPRSSAAGVGVVILLAVLIVAAALYAGRGASDSKDETSKISHEDLVDSQVAGQLQVDVSIDETDPALGEDNAPVTIVEFSDFECPFCRQFHRETFFRLKQSYIDTGRVRYIYKHFPLSQVHPRALAAAIASQCAHEQGKFWEYADLLMKEEAALSDDDLRAYAAEVGLNGGQFGECLTNEERRGEVTDDQLHGIAIGVTATPSFVINGKLVEGAFPFESLATMIEAARRGPDSQ